MTQLIFDRTESDVRELRELKKKILSSGVESLTPDEYSSYFGGHKGAYGKSDLNRVGNYMLEIKDFGKTIGEYIYSYRVAYNPIFGMGVIEIAVSPKINYRYTDIPTIAHMEHYLDDINEVRNKATFLTKEYKIPTNMNDLSIISANAIEEMLNDVGTYIEGRFDEIKVFVALIIKNQVYSNEVMSGEV